MEGHRVLERLVSDGRLDRTHVDRVVLQAERDGETPLDLLIDAGIMAEAELLKFAAAMYQTQFVGTEKLVKAPIERAVLELVPIRVVERFAALPILLDRRTQTLSVVLADSEQFDAEKQILVVSGVRLVRTYVGRPRTVRALIRRWYYGDVKPLQALLEVLRAQPAVDASNSSGWAARPGSQGGYARSAAASASSPGTGMSDYGMAPDDSDAGFDGPTLPSLPGLQNLPSLGAIPSASESGSRGAPSIGIDLSGFGSVPTPANAPRHPEPPSAAAPPSDFEDIPGLDAFAPPEPRPKSAPSWLPPATPVPAAPPVQPAAAKPFLLPVFDLSGVKPPPPSIVPPPPVPVAAPAAGRTGPDASSAIPALKDAPGVSVDTLIETTSVLVALLEQGREELRAHSAQVARLTDKVLDRIGVDDTLAKAAVLAAHLHDVGKSSNYHLTPLNVAQYDGHRAQAQRSFLAPGRLFESANLPRATLDALSHLYERFDGQGFPDRITGREIPLGARVLAVVESYVDITTNSRNPYRKVLTAKEACDALTKLEGQVFDPTVVDVMRVLVLGDETERKLNVDRRRVLIVDSDPEETTVLEMRLAGHGYAAVVVRDPEAGLKKLGELSFDMLISEVDFPGADGFRFLSRVKTTLHPDLPILVLTRRADRESVDRGFALGVSDYLVKPASADVVAAKIRLTLGADKPMTAAKVRGVSGQLSEMSLPDVVQIFSNGRRTGRLTLRSEGRIGEIHFRDGLIFDASFGPLVEANAVYTMLALDDGEFELDSAFVPETNRIQSSTESLLLEGMRRLDEARR